MRNLLPIYSRLTHTHQDTTAGAMSSLVYYFAKHPEMQARARAEVRAAVGAAAPTIDNMRDTPFVPACIREALRVNTPIVSVGLCHPADPASYQKSLTLIRTGLHGPPRELAARRACQRAWEALRAPREHVRHPQHLRDPLQSVLLAEVSWSFH